MNYTLALCKVGDIGSWCLRARTAPCGVRKKWDSGGKKPSTPRKLLQERDGKSAGTRGSLLQRCL